MQYTPLLALFTNERWWLVITQPDTCCVIPHLALFTFYPRNDTLSSTAA